MLSWLYYVLTKYAIPSNLPFPNRSNLPGELDFLSHYVRQFVWLGSLPKKYKQKWPGPPERFKKHFVADTSPLPLLQIQEVTDEGCFFSQGPEKKRTCSRAVAKPWWTLMWLERKSLFLQVTKIAGKHLLLSGTDRYIGPFNIRMLPLRKRRQRKVQSILQLLHICSNCWDLNLESLVPSWH